MSPDDARRDSLDPRRRVLYAHSDLAFARVDPDPGMLLATACYHAQQAAEKAVKAVLLFDTGEAPPKTHDIGRLLLLVRGLRDVPPDVAKAASLTDYAVWTRYPDDLDEADEAERAEAVALAQAAVAWAEGVVGR